MKENCKKCYLILHCRIFWSLQWSSKPWSSGHLESYLNSYSISVTLNCNYGHLYVQLEKLRATGIEGEIFGQNCTSCCVWDLGAEPRNAKDSSAQFHKVQSRCNLKWPIPAAPFTNVHKLLGYMSSLCFGFIQGVSCDYGSSTSACTLYIGDQSPVAFIPSARTAPYVVWSTRYMQIVFEGSHEGLILHTEFRSYMRTNSESLHLIGVLGELTQSWSFTDHVSTLSSYWWCFSWGPDWDPGGPLLDVSSPISTSMHTPSPEESMECTGSKWLPPKGTATGMEQDENNIGIHLNLVQVHLDNGYFRDKYHEKSDMIKDLQAPWDPGEPCVKAAWGQAESQGVGDVSDPITATAAHGPGLVECHMKGGLTTSIHVGSSEEASGLGSGKGNGSLPLSSPTCCSSSSLLPQIHVSELKSSVME
ncbi:hypothetical protein VPH35_085795 [Triticum aestivum]